MVNIFEGTLKALDPTVGNDLVEKYGPILSVFVWLVWTFCLAMGWMPTNAFGTTAYGALSGTVGIYVKYHATPVST